MFYFDEELQEWVDDESGEVPLPPREELKYRNEPPSPPSFGRSGKYVMGKLPNDYVPEERPSDSLSMPSMLTPKDYGYPMAGSGPYDPETSAMITGYGKNLMLRKAGREQPWLLPGGDMAPPEYVQDVEKTMGELDRGEMSETQLGEKIKRNEGIIPPGRRPSEGEVNIVDFVNFHMNDVEPKLREQAKAAREQYIKSVSYTTRALNEAGYDAKGAEIEQKTYNELRNEEKALATRHAERLQKLEDEKKSAALVGFTSDNKPVAKNPKTGQLIYADTKEPYTGGPLRPVTDKDSERDKAIDVPGLARAVADGQDAPVAIKGSMGNPLAAKVKSEVLKEYPKFDFNMADANYKWKQSATNQRTINFAGGALPRLGALDDQLAKLPSGDINVINKVMATVSKQFGKPEYTNFEANRNAIVQEINTALSGTSQASDLRIKIELENLDSARSPAQIKGAIANLRSALEARVDVDLNPLYPIEVVRGEKSMSEYKKEMFKKYRGKYENENTGSAGRTVVERRKTASGKILTKYSDGSIE